MYGLDSRFPLPVNEALWRLFRFFRAPIYICMLRLGGDLRFVTAMIVNGYFLYQFKCERFFQLKHIQRIRYADFPK